MKFLEITPFIRFAYELEYITDNEEYTSNDCRLFFILEGDGEIIVNNVIYNFTQFTTMLWQQNTNYRFNCKNPIKLIAVNFDYTAARTQYSQPFKVNKVSKTNMNVTENIDKIYFQDYPILNSAIICNNIPIYKTLSAIIEEKNSGLALSTEKASTMLKSVIIDIIRHAEKQTRPGDIAKKLDLVIDYIHKNYMKEINNEKIAEIVNYHPNYLNRVFLAAHGITIHKYITNYRITVAEQLLIATDLPISKIAESVGFSSRVPFTLIFKNINGIKPSEYRKRFSI